MHYFSANFTKCTEQMHIRVIEYELHHFHACAVLGQSLDELHGVHQLGKIA